ncbi:hypothetical protein ABPG72_005889 [Tetrahymena utriculariae]
MQNQSRQLLFLFPDNEQVDLEQLYNRILAYIAANNQNQLLSQQISQLQTTVQNNKQSSDQSFKDVNGQISAVVVSLSQLQANQQNYLLITPTDKINLHSNYLIGISQINDLNNLQIKLKQINDLDSLIIKSNQISDISLYALKSDIQSTDLTNYYNKQQVDQKISSIKIDPILNNKDLLQQFISDKSVLTQKELVQKYDISQATVSRLLKQFNSQNNSLNEQSISEQSEQEEQSQSEQNEQEEQSQSEQNDQEEQSVESAEEQIQNNEQSIQVQESIVEHPVQESLIEHQNNSLIEYLNEKEQPQEEQKQIAEQKSYQQQRNYQKNNNYKKYQKDEQQHQQIEQVQIAQESDQQIQNKINNLMVPPNNSNKITSIAFTARISTSAVKQNKIQM